LYEILQYTDFDYYIENKYEESTFWNPTVEGIMYSLAFGIKSCVMIFIFIWARASFPRVRFDQLMSFCWTVLLPIIIAFIILVPCILYSFEILPSNISLL
jgi:NADH-ubiquinone oxidoreductase chain 1